MTRKTKTRVVSVLALILATMTGPREAVAQAEDSSCFAGGPGSSQCSIEAAGVGCSVTCNSGFYACCSALGCRCLGGAE